MKTPKQSEVIMTEIVYPNDTNPMGILQGGKLMHWMDTASAICAQTHSGKIAVTASIDRVVFKNPVHIGDIVTIRAKITRAFTTSMEIFVVVKSRKVHEPKELISNTAYFTFVALDENARPVKVDPVTPITVAERLEYDKAIKRRNLI